MRYRKPKLLFIINYQNKSVRKANFMREHYEILIKDAERRAKKALRFQVNDLASVKDGGFKDSKNVIQPKFAIYRVVNLAAVYMNKESALYGNEGIKNAIIRGLNYIKREQRQNGTFDLVDCNFYSGPDTAFCIKRLLPFYKYVLKNPDTIGVSDFKDILKDIIYSGMCGMVTCGFHTPNHRWAIASNLLEGYRLFGNKEFFDRANEYLAEGIDCTGDGEYAERSAGNYNRINNDAMITIGEILGEEKYIDCAERNLTMMLTYIEPDDSIFTNNSTRQDRGVVIYPRDYYFEYLYMGVKRSNHKFLMAANHIMEVNKRENHFPEFLINYMLYPELIDTECDESGIATTYDAFYKESGIVRRRKDNWSYTIINNATNFVWFKNGDLCLSLKIGASFCEHRAFKSETLEKNGNSYDLHETMRGWYYLPFGKNIGTTDWWKMDNPNTREKLLGPDLNFDVTVTEIEDGLSVNIKASGVDRAPLRLELAFDAGCDVVSDNFNVSGLAGECMTVKNGMITATKGDYAIEVGPAFYAHDFVAGKFGSEGRSPQCFTIYFTENTEFEKTITIKAKDGIMY